MISLESSIFFLPTRDFRRLSILLAIYHEPCQSQMSIARRSGLSSAMVNTYIHELVENEIIKISPINKRDFEYSLTEAGRELLFSLLMECSAEIVRLYAQAKQELVKKFTHFFDKNKKMHIVLFGGAETAAMVIQAIHNFPNVELVGIVDNDPQKWGTKLEGLEISPPKSLSAINPDAIVIASFAKQNEIFESIRHLEAKGIAIIKLSSL